MRRVTLVGIWWVAVSACTPLGLWVYEEPGFEVSRVRLRADSEGAASPDSTVLVALAISNPNDYDIETARFELRLRLNDRTVGRFERDSIVSMGKVATTTLALAFTPTSSGTPARLAAYRSGTHRFLVEGRAIYKTPFGEHRVRVAHSGAIAFGEAVQPKPGTGGGSERRPGAPPPDWSPGVWPRIDPNPRP